MNKFFTNNHNSKKFHIIADNDHQSFDKGNNNAGIIAALNAMEIVFNSAKLFIPPKIKNVSDWDDLWHFDKTNHDGT